MGEGLCSPEYRLFRIALGWQWDELAILITARIRNPKDSSQCVHRGQGFAVLAERTLRKTR